MPIRNYCKKCQQEVQAGELCPLCGGKLIKTGERLSWTVRRTPVRDWFAWQAILRVALPVLGLVTAAVLAMEFAVGGHVALQLLVREGFLQMMLLAFCGAMLAACLLLCLQGEEFVQYILDKEGAHAYVYLPDPRTLRLWARFLTPGGVRALQEKLPEPTDMPLIQYRRVLWQQVCKAQFLPEYARLLLCRPRWWLALAVQCVPEEYAEAEAFARKRMARVPAMKRQFAREVKERKAREKAQRDREKARQEGRAR